MTSGLVDLRSDTVTRPTPEMRRAMAMAEVGDDGFGEDPTVNALEAAFAERLGKPAALYVPSGTMANQIAVRLLARPGTLVVAGRRQHLVAYELGAAARNASVQLHPLDDPDGTLDPRAVAEVVAAADFHQPEVSLVAVENTHMAASGAVWSLGALAQVRGAAGGVPLYMDGARLFNAEVASGIPAARFAAEATAVMCCLSKGLCAPVGSLLAGPADLMAAARDERKRLGGGMRQAGIVAAAGLVALATMVERLAEDHHRARQLAEAVAGRYPECGLDPDRVTTNMVVFPLATPGPLLAHLRGAGVAVELIGPTAVRLVTHHDLDDAGIERACTAIAGAPAA